MRLRIREISEPSLATRHVARNLRQSDSEELWDLGRNEPEPAITQSVELSTEAYVAYVDDIPAAVFGAHVTALGDTGVPWFLGTDAVDRHTSTYIPMARKFIEHLHTKCDVLQNVASVKNRRTLVFLSRLGFDIGEPFIAPTGASAVMFWRVKTDV